MVMNRYLIVVFFLAFASLSIGQAPPVSPMPSASPENSRIRNFGSSLEKYYEKENKKSRNDQKKTAVKTDDEDVIRIETDLVLHHVLVTDQKGNVITGLDKGDFVVTEDGVPQTIEIHSSGMKSTVPRSIVLIIDCNLLQTPYLKMSVEAAKSLIEKLMPQDKMAIVTTDGMLLLDFTADRNLLKQALDYVEKKGRELATWYWSGWSGLKAKKEGMAKYETVEATIRHGRGGQFYTLMAVLNELFDEPGRQRIVLLQGDGASAIWLKPDKDLPYPVSETTRMNSGMKYTGRETLMSKFGFSEVKESIEGSQTSIYSIITGIRFFGLPEKERRARARISRKNLREANASKDRHSSEQERLYEDREEKVRTAGQAAMYRVAELSGGNTAIMEKPEDAERIYSAILAVIESRYVLGYYPANREQGPKRRSVKVEVRGHPEYIITGRNVYVLR